MHRLERMESTIADHSCTDHAMLGSCISSIHPSVLGLNGGSRVGMRLSFCLADGQVRALDVPSKFKGPLVIGRDRETAQLVIPDSSVSRAHAALSIRDGKLVLEDLESRNGIWFNDRRVSKAVVKPGLVLRLGFAEIEFTKGDASRASEDRLLGQEISGYRFRQVMGKGSFGTVYRAEQVTLGREVAVKVLSEKHQKNPVSN